MDFLRSYAEGRDLFLSYRELRGVIDAAAKHHRLHPALLRAVIKTGSAYNPYRISADGRLGLMQISREMAEKSGVADVFDPAQNIEVGARRLRKLIDEFHSVRLALVAYRESPALIRNHSRGARPKRGTENFVIVALQMYRNMRLVYRDVR